MKNRKYNNELIERLQSGQYEENKDGVTICVKPIPEVADSGDMDPRLYKSMRMLPILMRFIKIDNPKNKSAAEQVKPFRKIMSAVKSRPIADLGVVTTKVDVKGGDGHIVPIRMYKREKCGKNLPIYVYYHGGGFFGGSPDVVEQMCKLVVQNYDCIAVNVDYRLCPESHYPMPFDDCFAATKYVFDNAEKLGGNRKKICVSGDSAGGNLAAAMAMKDKTEGGGMIALQALLYPVTDISSNRAVSDKSKYIVSARHNKVLNCTISMMDGLMNDKQVLSDIYLQGYADPEDIYVSPSCGDQVGIPPTLLVFGEHDMLVFDNFRYAKALVAAKVQLTTIVYRGLGHGFADQIGVLPQAEDCMLETVKFMKRYFD